MELDPPKQPCGQAFTTIVYQIPHVKSPYQPRKLALPYMGVDRGAHGGNELFEILSTDVRAVVQLGNRDGIALT